MKRISQTKSTRRFPVPRAVASLGFAALHPIFPSWSAFFRSSTCGFAGRLVTRFPLGVSSTVALFSAQPSFSGVI
jgi:hypothetical protein